MLGSQTRPTTLVCLSALYGLFSTTVHLALIFAVAVVFFGFDISHAHVATALTVFFFSVITFIAFGILAATAIVQFKRGDPVTWLFTNLGVVLGGAYFPLEVMPGWLQRVSWFNPITHSLEALRLTLLKGYSFAQVAEPLWFLAGTGIVLLPLSLALFSWSVRKGRKDGTLMQY
ncbi:MAG: ABC transporter permease, partial [Planctomycetes bacterium]|nr:ABC transporter permease [Planctomycetota bacterium]